MSGCGQGGALNFMALANKLLFFRDHRPGRGPVGTIRTERARARRGATLESSQVNDIARYARFSFPLDKISPPGCRQSGKDDQHAQSVS